jgi:ArsR family transcriptional regulator, arsenate/arsenite/antimonite-responsive transcriptional repressor
MSKEAEKSSGASQLPSDLFGALGDDARLDLLRELQRGTRCVCDLSPRLGMPPNLLSYHLRVLREAGLVERTRVGRRVEYRVRRRALEELTVALIRLAVGDDEHNGRDASQD